MSPCAWEGLRKNYKNLPVMPQVDEDGNLEVLKYRTATLPIEQ
jgi:hypothetical protein